MMWIYISDRLQIQICVVAWNKEGAPRWQPDPNNQYLAIALSMATRFRSTARFSILDLVSCSDRKLKIKKSNCWETDRRSYAVF